MELQTTMGNGEQTPSQEWQLPSQHKLTYTYTFKLKTVLYTSHFFYLSLYCSLTSLLTALFSFVLS